MNIAKLTAVALVSIWIATASAQNLGRGDKDNREVLRMGLYPPDILMRQQQKLGITNEQRSAIAGLVRTFQADVTEMQWSMPAEQQTLRDMLNRPEIDTEAALAQATRVVEMESKFKLEHFKLLIAIKNELTAQQVGMLNEAIGRRIKQD